MGMEDISPEVRKFIADHIHSVEAAEVLLLLRDGRERAWSAQQVQAVIRSSVASVTRNLDAFAAAGMLEKQDGRAPTYHYLPASLDLEHQISGLADTYHSRRVTVLELIYAEPSSDLRTFSDAFKFRRQT